MSIFRDLWWYFKRERLHYGLGILTLFVVALLELFPPYAVGLIVDAIKQRSLTPGELGKWLLLLGLTAIVLYILRFIWRILLFGAGFRLERLLRQRLYNHYTLLSPRFFHQRRTGDLMAHATNDIEAIELTAGDGVLTLVDSLFMGGAVVFTMAFFIDWQLTLVALLPMPLMAWATSHYGNLIHQRFHKAQEAFSTLNDKVQENISGIRVVKAFGQEEAEKRDFEKLTSDVTQKNIAVARVDALFDPTIALIVGLSFFLAVSFGSYLVIQDRITIGKLTQFTIYLGHLIWPMLAFGMLINIMERGRASYDRVRELLAIRPDITDREDALDQVPTGDISVQIAAFTYPDKEEPALRNISVDLKPGQTLGIVGRTGSGKTTFCRLLLREFDVEEGAIRIGGIPVTRFRLGSLRKAFGYVPQDHFLFSATIAENIAFGKPDATREEIERAARLACIHEDILQFPKGYDTVVGERGVTLSGGQKQRISIARALLIDPEILILDDSLSAVDAKTETAILQALRANRANRTTIITAHRLSAVEKADHILVLENGRIREQGTHEQLMAQNGWYAAMYRRQQLESLVAQGGVTRGDA
ncbi:ATP-binding cassette subfamily B protein [Planifilum fimeticola]|uniref:ATP-binding cassette subfamily B protein n=1 Tax=Planifilum fimeticola TaxID=201975 RepID=A0A2T0LJV7_9BACL|nr:ABC transporter transmembrane domain-containing protein [Planifilum fimeticola]PRX42782.1 ATP-binding cassette subfamily B protein [Planifilum fimeticola]